MEKTLEIWGKHRKILEEHRKIWETHGKYGKIHGKCYPLKKLGKSSNWGFSSNLLLVYRGYSL